MSLHCGDLLVRLDDFQRMVVERGASKRRIAETFRNHGHAEAILGTFDAASGIQNAANDCDVAYVWETGDLFLKTKLALDTATIQTVERFSPQALV
ncbi:MAG: hypothetical protein ACREYF_10415 [Gammaproteobacteria bacterium]